MLKQRYPIVCLVLLSLPIFAESSNSQLIVATEQAADSFRKTTGTAEFSVRGRSVAGEVVSAEIEYRLPVPVVAGGSLMLRQHWTQTHRLQIETPASTNFVRIVSGEPSGVKLLARYVDVDDIAGELDAQASAIAFEVTSGELQAGTILRFVVDRLQLPTTAMDSYEIPLYFKNDRNAAPARVPGNTIAIEPDDFSDLSLFASSTTTPGDTIDLWLRLEDQYGNIARARTLSLDLLVNGVFRERVEVTTSVQKIDGISFDASGHYQLELRTGGGGIAAISNPVVVSNNPSKIVWADLGAPTKLSDGIQSAEELARAARGRYDLTLIADHEKLNERAVLSVTDGTSVMSHWKPLESGGGSLVLSKRNAASLTIASPELPADLRRMLPETLKLVEIASGGSVYDWFGNKAANFGFRVGFTGSNHSHQYPGQFREVGTAIWLKDGQHWFDAMKNHQTYVSVGSKMVLVASPANLALKPVRSLGLEIAADAPIVSVEVFKNGRLFKARRQPDQGGNRFRLAVESSSEPFSRLMSRPRNAREWVGYVATRDAGITVDSVGQYWQVKSGSQSGRVDFLTRTHGIEEFLEFELTSPNTDTVIEIGIAPGYEDAAWLPNDRLPKPTPGQKFLIPIAEAMQGGLRTFDVEGYRDSVRVEPVLVPFESSMRYEFDDPSTPHLGDYYYFRVRLVNGAFAYTSPIYVGDFE